MRSRSVLPLACSSAAPLVLGHSEPSMTDSALDELLCWWYRAVLPSDVARIGASHHLKSVCQPAQVYLSFGCWCTNNY